MSSTLNPDNTPLESGVGSSSDGDALGPSDSSDSGSDTRGAKRRPFDIDDELDAHALERGEAAGAAGTDRAGTGERASADGDSTLTDSADIEPDRTESLADEADALEDAEAQARADTVRDRQR
ncbi:hypothetical protein [Burkholderia glumae]|uniref:Chemotaxis protein n=1 Tax=Burkholderia glumae TaxID=337 RepID=A0AAQ0BTV9_BURGL|nr:hypothetical protein [Burkholderia glumae]ACR28330.1 Hypothetical protein bglu_1g11610 [Burkholderia glumae BGR1]AJY66163.1 hypothetical protein KS03_2098 [Burkholderia glumae LMG 2196 = ATCC 33617]KHJ59504.1 chemotaxis protein [Burkholderia glumae]MCM2480677.1 chemotaxis protein [Burkholderia glumae]MCM2509184.1 chemotaxis protein [Burkholderia glumae]